MRRCARAGFTVGRVKGGDPFQNGTRASQRGVVSRLADLRSPAIVVVGEVVSLADVEQLAGTVTRAT